MSEPNRSHAVVIGGSMAGLLAGRVLADHFDRVTVVERDHFPQEAAYRSGVPQGHHIHILLASGRQIIEQLFPGLFEELSATGARPIDLGEDAAFLLRTGWLARFNAGLPSFSSSRILLEWSIQRRLAANPRVHFIEGAQVTRLVTNDTKTQVKGVELQFRPGSSGEPMLDADLVVDASGRTSRAPDWLEALGYTRPQETVINTFIGYATRWYRRPADFSADWRVLFIASRPPHFARGGVVFAVENDQWVATVMGAARDYPPTDEAGFMEFARSLISPAFYEAIQHAEPLSPIYGYQRTANQLRHYERLTRWPEGLVVLGDAACAFNPVYGQGMSAAAMSAVALGETLCERRDSGMAPAFQRRLAKVMEPIWLLSTGEDFRYPTTEGGQRTLMTRLTHWYIDQVLLALPGNNELTRTFQAVAQLVEPPTTLFRPNIMAAALRSALKRQPDPRQLEELPAYWKTEHKVNSD